MEISVKRHSLYSGYVLSQTNPVAVKGNTLFCSDKFECMAIGHISEMLHFSL